MLTRWLPGLAISVWLGATQGCMMPQEPPGDLVGAYHIEGELTENSCGTAALPAADPLRFDVEIREQENAGLWLVGSPPAHPGALDADGDFRFDRQSTYDVGPAARRPVELLVEMDIERLSDPEAAQQLGDDRTRPCRLSVSERIEGTLLRDSRNQGEDDSSDDAASDDDEESGADLVGENEIAVRVAAGDCSASRAENGGPFEQLPCAVHYDLEGELIAR